MPGSGRGAPGSGSFSSFTVPAGTTEMAPGCVKPSLPAGGMDSGEELGELLQRCLVLLFLGIHINRGDGRGMQWLEHPSPIGAGGAPCSAQGGTEWAVSPPASQGCHTSIPPAGQGLGGSARGKEHFSLG